MILLIIIDNCDISISVAFAESSIPVQSLPCVKWFDNFAGDGHTTCEWHTSLNNLKHWTYKMLVGYILLSVCQRYSRLFRLSSNAIRGCVFSAYPSLFWWLTEYTYFTYIMTIKLEIWLITQCLRLAYVMRCTSCHVFMLETKYSPWYIGL